jgi:predicted nucleic acid-binding protein
MWLTTELKTRFAGRLLTIGAGVADHWGQLAGDAQRQGTPAPVIDGLLAATALHHHLTMVTRNIQDFMVHNNIQTFNPWDTP